MTNEFTIFDFNAHNFYSTARGAHSNLFVYVYTLYLYYYLFTLPPPLKVVKKNKDSSHNLRLSASIIVFCSRKLTSLFLSELFMPIPRGAR